MSETLQPLLDWLSLNPLYFGLSIFLVACLESLAIIGIIIPGVTLLFAIGVIISTGAMPFTTACIWAIAGAITGDGLSYWLGHKYAEKMPTIWPFKQHPKQLQSGIEFFHNNGIKSIVIGRFFGPLRAIVPLVAGMLKMPAKQFFIANILSAFLWAPIYLLPGMLIGFSMDIAFKLTLLFIILIFGKKLWHLFSISSEKILHLIHQKSQFTSNKYTQHFSGWIVLGSILIFFLILDSQYLHLFGQLNQQLLSTLIGLHSPSRDNLFIHISRLADNTPTFVFILSITAYFVLQQDHQRLRYWIILALGSIFIAPLIKFSLQVVRPDVLLHINSSYSFPSGHSLRAILLWGGLALLLQPNNRPLLKFFNTSLSIIIVLAIGLSRLYLGVHWLTDILASLAIGIILLGFIGKNLHQQNTQSTQNPFHLFAILLIILTSWGIQTNIYHAYDQRHYQLKPTQHSVNLQQWLEQKNTIPNHPIDLTGLNNNPFNIYFAGKFNQLKKQLAKQNWTIHTYSTQTAFANFLTQTDTNSLLPHIHAGQTPTITLEKTTPQGDQHILRLWLTNNGLEPNNTPIWLGQLSRQYNNSWLGLFQYSASDQRLENPLYQLHKNLLDSPFILSLETYQTSNPRLKITQP